MKTSNIIRFTILGLLWLWLASTILIRGGVNLLNLFWIAASGILVFVPLWRKYVAPQTEGTNGANGKKTNNRKGTRRKRQ